MMIDEKLLNEAWLKVKAKDTSIDHNTVSEVGKNIYNILKKLLSEIKDKTYLPQAFLQVEIPKDHGEKRVLGMSTVSDKIVQQALTLILEKKLEKTFLDTSYAYRKEKGALKALKRLNHYLFNDKNQIIIKCDIDNYFDSIPHSRLRKLLAPYIKDIYYLELIFMFCKMGYVKPKYSWQDRDKGIPQGAVLSPLLSNLYLHSLDQKMHSKAYNYLRYADDFLIVCYWHPSNSKIT